ncbi:MAG: EFR1 family ferrodoxin [Firmicutes bacterium]|nr:EFR1 family ferrodoxin [Bacillota bacterium]
MDGIKIYYFSGTGNCLWTARRIAEELGEERTAATDGMTDNTTEATDNITEADDNTTSQVPKSVELVAITAELIDARPAVQCDVCVLVFPSYAYGLPTLVRRFLKNSTFKVNYFAAVSTCGSHTGGSFTSIKRFLKKKKQALHFAAEVRSVENYVHIFGFTKEPKLSERLHNQAEKTAAAGELLAARTVNKVRNFRPFSALINLLFRAAKCAFPLFYKVKKTCNGCGLCYSICPSAAITMVHEKDKKARKSGVMVQKDDLKRPKFAAMKCDHCQACMQWCPKRAIKFMRVTPRSLRYHHPEVGVNELRKR